MNLEIISNLNPLQNTTERVQNFIQRWEEIYAQTHQNDLETENVAIDYEQFSGDHNLVMIDSSLRMPPQWYWQLGYYDRKVAKDIARHIFSEFRVLFWRDELHVQAREYARYPLPIIREMMRIRRSLSDAACYDQIFDRLAISAHIPKPVERQLPQVDEHTANRYDHDTVPLAVVEISIRHDLFHIREGLRFTMPENFLVGMGIQQQR